MSKRGKRSDRHGGKHFVQLPEWLLVSPAWRSLSVGARALYVEMKRRYRGSNNGDLRLSHREAAALLGLHRNSIGKLFSELEDKGFLRMLEGHYLGPSGIGMTARWALDEHPTDTDGKPALKRFMSWRENQNPRTKSVTPRHNTCDASLSDASETGATGTNPVTQAALARFPASQKTGHI